MFSSPQSQFIAKMSRTSAVCLVALVIALLYTIFTKPRVGLVIEIKTGQGIQGIISKSREGRDFYEWLGIPYAEPPVGELRYAVSYFVF